MDDQDAPPVHPGMVLLTGLALGVVSGFFLVADGSDALHIVGLVAGSIAGVVTTVGAVGWGVFLALRLDAWHKTH